MLELTALVISKVGMEMEYMNRTSTNPTTKFLQSSCSGSAYTK